MTICNIQSINELQNSCPRTSASRTKNTALALLKRRTDGVPPPVYETARPLKPGRVSYGVVNLYLTFLDDLFEVYRIGIQSEGRIGWICNTAIYQF